MPFNSVPGAELYWKLEGSADAPPLVLLNSIGTDMDLWDAALPALRGSFQLLRMDTRGHGASRMSPGDASLGRLAADVLAVADAAGFDRFSLAGVSLGGMIGMELALEQPKRLTALALICTSATMDRAAWSDRVDAVRSKGMEAIAELALGRFLSPGFRAAQPTVEATVQRQLLGMDPEGYAACAAAIRDMDLVGRLHEITCPTLVVTGDRDTSTPLAGHGERLLADIGGARHVALPTGHLAPLEVPCELADVLMDFLRT